MQLAVELEDDTTWPEPFREKAFAAKELVIEYQRERQRIDRLIHGENILFRINPPPNEHKGEYDSLVEQLEEILSPHRLVAYHCTRLTPREVEEIKTNGLRVLSAALVKKKIENCAADGHITQADAEYLLGSEHISRALANKYGNRTGHICYCPNRSTLRRSTCVYRLFQLWGGEATYWGYEDDDQISRIVRRVGTPYIVKCAVPWGDAKESCKPFSPRFLSHLVSDQIYHPEPSEDFDLFAKRDLEAGNILDLISYTDLRFLGLTEFNRWRPSERPEVLP